MHSKVKHIFICYKMEVNLISAICVKSFGMAIVKITCFIHNAFCFTASLPVSNFHFSLVKSTFQSVCSVAVNQGRDAVLLLILCYIVLLIPNTILPRSQVHTFHEFQRSRNQSPSSNPSSSTQRSEETTVIYFSFYHLWEQRALYPKFLKRKKLNIFLFLLFSKNHDIKEKKIYFIL